MGQLINGQWSDDDTRRVAADGSFLRAESQFRGWVSADGATTHPAESGRYHLYAAVSCPWAHRTLLMRAMKGLEGAISLSLVGPAEQGHGWEMSGSSGPYTDHLHGAHFIYEIYQRAERSYSGRATVPILWDKASGKIVNNESPEIIRMFNNAFNQFATRDLPDMVPETLKAEIERWNDFIYSSVNNGVYRAGFATQQDKYEDAVRGVFDTLDRLDAHLATHRYLCGKRLTEADVRLFPTLIRFDVVYHGHFKCNLRRLSDYPNLWAYTRDFYQLPGVAGTVDLDAYRFNYYRNQRHVNPSRVVAIGPRLDLTAPHGRERLG